MSITSKNLTSIGSYAFCNCKSLTSLTIPSSVTSIAEGAFQGCSSLKTVTIPTGVTSIQSHTFFECSNLETVDITSNLTSVGNSAFANCKNLISIIIPSTVESIGSNAFSYCKNLTSVIYLGTNDPEGVGAKDVFSGCEHLRFVCVPFEYDSSTFCGLDQFCKHESCESFLHNQCYEPVCDNGVITMEKRDNASEWENRTTGCYEFQCHNESGPIYWKQCNKTNEICENGQCVMEEEVTHSVVIEIETTDVIDFSMTEIQNTISNLTGIEEDRIRIRVITNDENEIVKIVVVVDDETTAEEIKRRIDQCKR